MLSILICAMLGQIKEGDSVYVKPPGANAWKTATMAATRYQPLRISGRLGDIDPVASDARRWFPAREKLSVLAVDDYEGEKLARVKDDDKQTWWMIASDLSKLDEVGQAALARDELTAKLKPFCITKPDHAALAVAVGKGIDPLTMTAQQAAALSPSQRKALAGIKARYQREKR